MKSHHHFFFFFLIIVILLSSRNIACGSSGEDYVYAGCSADEFSTSTPYQFNLNSLLTSLANSAGFSLYNNFTSFTSSASAPVYGLYQCRADISISDCESCVWSAIRRLSSTCPSSVAASVQLRGCLVRYANESFIGRSEKELLYKTCGPVADNGGGDAMAMRYAVFEMLKGGIGLYRTGSNGYVGGSAQCVGDQSAKQCEECVKEAVSDLASICSGSISGNVYLGKCYTEYWSVGAYDNSSPSDKNSHASEAGKDIAIIIGIVAAVLLTILLLNHLKKSAEERGKY